MNGLLKTLVTFLLITSITLNLGIVVFMNGYLKFLGTSKDIIQSIEGEEKGIGKFKSNIIDSKLEKTYIAISKKLGGKYYYDNSSKNKILIKKIYFFDNQDLKVNVTYKDKTTKSSESASFAKLVKQKKHIDHVQIFAINSKPLTNPIVIKGSALGLTDYNVSLE